jgi:hypothetical protein
MFSAAKNRLPSLFLKLRQTSQSCSLDLQDSHRRWVPANGHMPGINQLAGCSQEAEVLFYVPKLQAKIRNPPI